jgi:CDGSH-type Zn-finger protein
MTKDKQCICGRTSNTDGTCDGSHSNVCDDDRLDQNEDVPFADKF